MFFKVFLNFIKNIKHIIIALSLNAIVILVLVVVYFVKPQISKKVSIVFLGVILFLLLGNWFSNVIVPRTRLRKHIDPKYVEIKKQFKTNASDRDAAEIILYANGIAFSLILVLSVITPIIFILI